MMSVEQSLPEDLAEHWSGGPPLFVFLVIMAVSCSAGFFPSPSFSPDLCSLFFFFLRKDLKCQLEQKDLEAIWLKTRLEEQKATCGSLLRANQALSAKLKIAAAAAAAASTASSSANKRPRSPLPPGPLAPEEKTKKLASPSSPSLAVINLEKEEMMKEEEEDDGEYVNPYVGAKDGEDEKDDDEEQAFGVEVKEEDDDDAAGTVDQLGELSSGSVTEDKQALATPRPTKAPRFR